jgi:tetratricopeptide (TPR) repeat protein
MDIFLTLLIVNCYLLIACASVPTSDLITLDEAIEKSAGELTNKLQKGNRIAIVAFSSEHENLSNYIMDELTGAFVEGKIETADRRNLAYVFRELNFQMSGNISDETAVSIGKFLGVKYVVTGQFQKTGNSYRYRLSGINVETAVQETSSRYNVKNDKALQQLIADIIKNAPVTVTADYGEKTNAQPLTAGAYLDRGIYYASRRQWELATDNFTKAISLDKNLTAAYLLRGRVYYACASYVTSIGKNFSNVTANITEGWNATAERQKYYNLAITDFTEAIRLDPKSALAYRERGVTFSDKGDQTTALADLDNAILIAPNNATAYNNRGNIYRKKKEYDKAIEDYNHAIKIDPNYARAYMNRGGTYRDKGDMNRAIEDHTKAVKLAPDDAITYNERAGDYSKTGDYEKAIADYTQSIRIDPNYFVAYANRAFVYYTTGDYNSAISDYEAAVRLEPGNEGIKRDLEKARQKNK